MKSKHAKAIRKGIQFRRYAEMEPQHTVTYLRLARAYGRHSLRAFFRIRR